MTSNNLHYDDGDQGCGSSRMQLQLKNEELWAENAQLRSDNEALKAKYFQALHTLMGDFSGHNDSVMMLCQSMSSAGLFDNKLGLEQSNTIQDVMQLDYSTLFDVLNDMEKSSSPDSYELTSRPEISAQQAADLDAPMEYSNEATDDDPVNQMKF
ncbi:uncharacterized protein LOC108669513 [Hyalella azteca]|uniref:Uncharacterized protein LOC108669513 n=1 Tax=Hyalella azteca TaxID=294128 RepID=A0A8B7NFF6_HYAAZ|nr:uncharacterized protein LOC108669513 [Hyalella azteca]